MTQTETASLRRRSSIFEACRRLVERPAFDRAAVLVVLANAVVLGAETYDSAERRYGGVLDALNDAFLAIFTIELAIRFLAVRADPRRFFASGWNVFDFVVVGAAFVPGLAANTTLLRLARLLRAVRAVRLLPDLRVLVVAVGRAPPGSAAWPSSRCCCCSSTEWWAG